MPDLEHPLQGQSDEKALIASALAGGQLAWARLVERFSPILRGTVRSHLGLNDTDEALQNAWIRIWRSLDKYEPEVAPFIAFCRWHAKIASMDILRRNQRRRHEVPVEDLINRQGFDGDRDPLDWLATSGRSEENRDVEYFGEAGAPELRELIFCEFMRLTFSVSAPPHELICYGFNKLLGWKPRRIVSDLGHDRMIAVEMELESELEKESELSVAMINGCLEGIRSRLTSRLGDLITDQRTRSRYDGLLERVVATTALQEYFSSDPGGDISAWWWSVHRQVVREAEVHRTPEVDRVLEDIIW